MTTSHPTPIADSVPNLISTDPGDAVLQAILHPLARSLVYTHARFVANLVAGLGSPLHLLLPEVFDEVAASFSRALAAERVDGLILFAKKANKARCFAERCATLGLGVDVASAPELAQALAAGVRGESISVSGPAKAPELWDVATRHGCWISVDEYAELEPIAARATAAGRRARLLLRCAPDLPKQSNSRFGMTEPELQAALTFCRDKDSQLQLEGFSFHLQGYSHCERALMAHRLVDLCLESRSLGFDCRVVDIGGGFAVRYIESDVWKRFVATHQPTDFHGNRNFNTFYPYGSNLDGAETLTRILRGKGQCGLSLAERMTAHGLRLLLEPGRALMDQSGMTAFRIQGVKDRRGYGGYTILTAEGTSFSLSEQWFNSEFLPAPILLEQGLGERPREGEPFVACIAGCSCLESDMLSWRKIPFNRTVRVGDIIVYPNTAGYQMDSNESEFHELPLPRKVVLTGNSDKSPLWRLDDVATR